MDLFNELAQEAHDACTVAGSFSPREVATDFVERVEGLLAFGQPEPRAFLSRLMIDGASKWLTDWRRKSMVTARTKTGAIVDLPRYAGVRDDDGEHKQMALFERLPSSTR